MSIPNYYASFPYNVATVKIVYYMMLEEKRVGRFGSKLKDGFIDITDYYLENPTCALGLISKYWIWRIT
jgi:hypothetical protein